MKNYLFIVAALLLLCSCNNRIHTMDLDTGVYRTLLDNQDFTVVGDTLVLRTNSFTKGTLLQGKYLGKLPNTIKEEVRGVEYKTYFHKSVRIK